MIFLHFISALAHQTILWRPQLLPLPLPPADDTGRQIFLRLQGNWVNVMVITINVIVLISMVVVISIGNLISMVQSNLCTTTTLGTQKVAVGPRWS
jgi:hypothetical protein